MVKKEIEDFAKSSKEKAQFLMLKLVIAAPGPNFMFFKREVSLKKKCTVV